jgi:hypothetical protein
MNTSAKGSAYENAYKRSLAGRTWFVLRAAASKGPFDLVAAMKDELGLRMIQCKGGQFSCSKAEGLVKHLWMTYGMPQLWFPYVVHRTKEKEFCEH